VEWDWLELKQTKCGERQAERGKAWYNGAMVASLSQTELTLLQYLHEHSGGSGERIWLDPKPIARRLRISVTQFAADSASLAALGFAGVRDFRADANDVPSAKRSAIWLTGKGEDYLRLAQYQRRAVAPPRLSAGEEHAD
jgi:hypothetical protein